MEAFAERGSSDRGCGRRCRKGHSTMSRAEFPRLQTVLMCGLKWNIILRGWRVRRGGGRPSPSPPSLTMSLSPTTSNDTYDPPTGKRRRTSFTLTTAYGSGTPAQMMSPQDQAAPQQGAAATPQSHIPKRGARACTACRKGKNRCEGEVRTACLICVLCPRFPPSRCLSWPAPSARPGSSSSLQAPCRRCQLSGTPCIFEKPEKKNVQAMSNASVE